MQPRLLLLLDNAYELARSLVELATLPFAFARTFLRPQSELAAENLFLRRQMGYLIEHGSKPRRPSNGTRLALVWLSRLFDWKDAIAIGKPRTLIRWHRRGYRLLWRWKSRPLGRPPIPEELQQLIVWMATENDWGEERIASEMLLKTGVRLSPRTARKYMPDKPRDHRRRARSRRWSTFIRNHAKEIVACDFLTSVTLGFRRLYVFVVLHVGSRRILHVNVTANPTAEWTLQQFRGTFACEHDYKWLIHDRDAPFSEGVDLAVKKIGIQSIGTPRRVRFTDAYCERVNGTIRRECPEHFIPPSEAHLRRLLREWVEHYNSGRPHSSLSPGIPDPQKGLPIAPQECRHLLPSGSRVTSKPILGGLDHEHRLEVLPATTLPKQRMDFLRKTPGVRTSN